MADEPKGIHGGLKFLLLFFPGILLGVLFTVAALSLIDKGQGLVQLVYCGGTVVLFFSAIVLGPVLKWWGCSGLALGASIPVACFALLTLICR